ncbi:MAG TPA: cupin domain-containing protein, partial [Phnomibacter sp.]|nr:cupin domain-containing protein [Phnomibacter sp.]
MLRLQHLITTLNLQPHPEGGFFAETYRSALLVDTPTGPRPASTAIYFLLTPGSFSAFHRIAFDECWHHYEGDPVHIHVLHTQGRYEQLALGPLNHVGQAPQAMVPGGAWFASHLEPPAGPPAAGYALVGC